MTDSDGRSALRVDLGASARAELKASIPEASTGRLLDALTDLIRPFSEKRGLKADQIRIQREDVLLEIARKARNRAELEGTPIKPVPLKFMIPFLEHASCEDLGSELIDNWSNLLASAASEFKPEMIRSLHCLSQIGPRESRILKHIAFRDCWPVTLIEDAPYTLQIYGIRNMFADVPATMRSYREFVRFLKDHVNRPGSVVTEVAGAIRRKRTDLLVEDAGEEFPGASYSDAQVSIGILESLNLISLEQFRIEDDRFEFIGERVFLTAFGVKFLVACDSDIQQAFKTPRGVGFFERSLVVELADGRSIEAPIEWYPRLAQASDAERRNFVLGPLRIRWPDLDVDLSVAGMLRGEKGL